MIQKTFKYISLSFFTSLFLPYIFCCSTKTDNQHRNRDIRKIDGSNWYGLFGKFKEEDYIIDENLQIVTYTSAKNLTYAINLVLPDQVEYQNNIYDVYFDKYTFSSFNIRGNLYLNKFMSDIPDYLFESCAYIENIYLQTKIRTVGKRSFWSCFALKSIEYAKDSIYANLPYQDIWMSMESIDINAFYYTAFNFNIYLSSNLQFLAAHAFDSCTKIKSVYFLDDCLSYQRTLPSNAFSNCWALQYVLLNSSIVYISEEAFSGCHNLLTVDWKIHSNDVNVFIRYKAFYQCSKLQSINSLDEYGFSPYSIGDEAFNLDEELYIDDLNFQYKVCNFFKKTTFIGKYSFSGCKQIKSINLTNDDLIISSFAFTDCTYLNQIDFSHFREFYFPVSTIGIFEGISQYGTFYLSRYSHYAKIIEDLYSQMNNKEINSWNIVFVD